jgi:hypothetical protein
VEYFAGYFVGLDEKPFSGQQFYLYPNPSDGHFAIELPKSNTEDNNRIFIYNSMGSIVWQGNSANDLINIDISSLARGIYFVKICNADKIITQKVVIE